jgi:hypothetical protein
MTVSISVNQEYVYAEVNTATAYLATKNNSEKIEYDRIATVKSDTDLLDRYYKEAIGILNTVMREFIYKISTSDTSYELILSMAASYDPMLNTALQTAVNSFVISYILSKWLVVVDKKEATNAEHEAAEHLTDIRAKIYYRKKPVRVSPVKSIDHLDKNTSGEQYEVNPDTTADGETPGSSD